MLNPVGFGVLLSFGALLGFGLCGFLKPELESELKSLLVDSSKFLSAAQSIECLKKLQNHMF